MSDAIAIRDGIHRHHMADIAIVMGSSMIVIMVDIVIMMGSSMIVIMTTLTELNS